MDSARRETLARALRDDRRRTSDRIRALTRDLQDIIERSNDAARDDEHDPEGATIAFERAQVRALLDAAEAQLRELDAAERRLATGELDRCAGCGAAIPDERLLVRPTARTCVDCAEATG